MNVLRLEDPYEPKYQLLITKIEYSNDMDDIYQNIDENKPNKNGKYKSFLMIC